MREPPLQGEEERSVKEAWFPPAAGGLPPPQGRAGERLRESCGEVFIH